MAAITVIKRSVTTRLFSLHPMTMSQHTLLFHIFKRLSVERKGWKDHELKGKCGGNLCLDEDGVDTPETAF